MHDSLIKLHKVCEEIEKEWRKSDDNIEIFPEIVLEKTQNLDLSEFGEISNIMRILDDPYVSHLQKLTSFSDLYLLLWHNGRFHVEVLNWWGTDINIHDHNFTGVQFQLKGDSLNVVYDSENTERTSRFSLGKLSVKKAEIWKKGTRSIVRQGGMEPHTVYHLSFPTVSLLFRTIPSPDFGPQLNYFPPSIRANYSVADVKFRKKLTALRLISSKSPVEFNQLFNQVIKSQTLTENLFTIIKLNDILFKPDFQNLLIDFASQGDKETQLIKSASYRKSTELLDKIIKERYCDSINEKLAISILASSFDSTSLNKILSVLNLSKTDFNFDTIIKSIYIKLPNNLQSSFLKILELYGLIKLSINLTK